MLTLRTPLRYIAPPHLALLDWERPGNPRLAGGVHIWRKAEAMKNRQGMSLIEVLVTIAIIGVLVAITLPAIQAAREAARRSACRNNLKQMGLALMNYESIHGCLPPAGGANGFSFIARILPQLEQGNLYNTLNFEGKLGFRENHTVQMTRIEMLLCPSDGGGSGRVGVTSYAGNHGCGYDRFGENGAFVGFMGRPPVALRDVTDGLSSTAMVSEWVLGPVNLVRDPLASTFNTPRLDGSDRFDEFVAACAGIDPSRAPIIGGPDKGATWPEGHSSASLYNHVLPPNSYSCTNGYLVSAGAWTAGSRHAGGAHTLYMDGRVGFSSRAIDREVWRSLGSRDGGEIISAQ